MDEMLKALTNLINTGGALADDALYLYFLMKVSQAFAFAAALWAAAAGVAKCIKVGMDSGARNTYLNVIALWGGEAIDEKHPSHKRALDYIERARQAYEGR